MDPNYGLGYECVKAIVREHKYRPIASNVIIVGRQTVYFTPEQILKLLREHCVDVEGVHSADLDIDLSTTNRHYRFRNIDSISDPELFRLIGVPKVLALDHSDYEGADIVHDLTKPIPQICVDAPTSSWTVAPSIMSLTPRWSFAIWQRC